MDDFYERVKIAFTADVVVLKSKRDGWVNELYKHLDYQIRGGNTGMLVGQTLIHIQKEKANEPTTQT